MDYEEADPSVYEESMTPGFEPFNEYYDDDFTVSSSLTHNSAQKKQKKQWDEIKEADKGFHKIPRTANRKTTYIQCYSTSSTPGVAIRNAVTGVRQHGYMVGSKKEHLFFKVAYAGLRTKLTVNEPCILFFDTPEQYERHMNTTLDSSIKTKWINKYMEVHALYNKE